MSGLRPAGSTQRSTYNLTCEVFGAPAGLYGPSSAASPLLNPRFSLFNALLINVLNWGDTVRPRAARSTLTTCFTARSVSDPHSGQASLMSCHRTLH